MRHIKRRFRNKLSGAEVYLAPDVYQAAVSGGQDFLTRVDDYEYIFKNNLLIGRIGVDGVEPAPIFDEKNPIMMDVKQAAPAYGDLSGLPVGLPSVEAEGVVEVEGGVEPEAAPSPNKGRRGRNKKREEEIVDNADDILNLLEE